MRMNVIRWDMNVALHHFGNEVMIWGECEHVWNECDWCEWMWLRWDMNVAKALHHFENEVISWCK